MLFCCHFETVGVGFCFWLFFCIICRFVVTFRLAGAEHRLRSLEMILRAVVRISLIYIFSFNFSLFFVNWLWYVAYCPLYPRTPNCYDLSLEFLFPLSIRLFRWFSLHRCYFVWVVLVVEHIDKFDDGKFKLFCFMLIFTFDLNAQRTTSVFD